MSKPKGAMGASAAQPVPQNTVSGLPDYENMMNDAFNDLGYIEAPKPKQEIPQQPKPEVVAVSEEPIEEKIIESINNNSTFEKEFKKELVGALMDADVLLDEVSDTKIKFSKDNKQYVIIPMENN